MGKMNALWGMICAIGLSGTAYAVPAAPGVVQRYMPDGTVVPVRIVGDEFGRSVFSEDGWPLIEENGTMWFAETAADGSLRPSAYAVAKRDVTTDRWLSTLDKEAMTASISQTREGMRRSAMMKNPGLHYSSFPHKGEPRALVILVEYQDVSCTLENPNDYFEKLLNQEGFKQWGGTGSARDYFVQNSSGAFRPHFDFYGPVKLPQPISYYGGNVNGSDAHAEDMVIHACQILDPTVDFSEYDHDKDGLIDNVFIFFAGRGENSGGDDSTVWPHSWDVRSPYPDEKFMFDGVQLGHYACTNEWRGSRPDGIGVFVHEFSHVLGLPDLYVTGGANTGAFTPNAWSVLDYGPYNNNACTPAGYSLYERYALEWVEPRELTKADNITILPLMENNDGCIIRVPSNPNEYFLLENRQHTAWDRFIPGHGMLIWHVDYDADLWENSGINNDPAHQHVDLIEADNQLTRTSYPGDSFPGTAGVTSFTNDTRPAMKTWTGDVLELPITEIAESKKGIITFKVAGGLPDSETPEALEATEVGSYSFKARWRPVQNVEKYEVTVTIDSEEEPVLVKETAPNVSELLVADLAPETKYYYTVSACQIGKGMSPASQKVEVTTGETTFEWYAPEVVAATGVYDKGFTATWMPLEDAAEYFVTLFNKSEIVTDPDYQDFTGGITSLSAGWTSTTEFTFENDAYSGDGYPSLRMPGGGATLESCVYPTDVHSLVFWHRGSNKTAGNKITVSAFVDGEWKEHAVLDVTEHEGGRIDTVVGFPFGTRAIRIYYKGTGRNNGPLALDDVTVNREISYTKSIINGIDRKSAASANTLKIDGLTPDTEYFYTVMATDGTLMSKESKPMRVKTYPLGQGGVENLPVDLDASSPVEYYNLQGIRISSPVPGQIVIERRGGNTVKRIIR